MSYAHSLGEEDTMQGHVGVALGNSEPGGVMEVRLCGKKGVKCALVPKEASHGGCDWLV